MKNKLLVLSRDQDKYRSQLGSLHLPDLEIILPESKDDILANIASANIILANPVILKNYINSATNLAWVQSIFAGVDSLVTTGVKDDYILTNVKDVYGQVMAEYVLAYILFFEKELSVHQENQRTKTWNQKPYQPIKDKTVGLMGTGSIGIEVAAVLKGLGLTVLGYKTNLEPVKNFDQVFDYSSKEEFLKRSDYVVSILPNTKNTKHLINEDFFGVMKPTAVFMNIGRGDNISESCIISALKEKKIKAAVLDVFQQEPLPADHDFWNLDNLFITPHVAGYTINDGICDIFKENYLRFIDQKEMIYQVDFIKGY